MRLAVFLPRLQARPGGLGVYLEGMFAPLAEKHPGTLLLTGEPGELPSWTRPFEPVRPAGALGRAAGRLHPRLRRLLLLQVWARREVSRRGVDVLIVPFHDGVYRCPVSQVIVVHDLKFESDPKVFPRAVTWYARHVFRPTLRTAQRVVAVSESTRRDLIARWSIPAERVRVVYEGCDRGIFRPLDPATTAAVGERLGLERPYLLYSGTLLRHKNLDVVLRGLALCAAEERPPRLVVTTRLDDPGLPALERRIRALELDDRVRVLDYLPRGDLAALMAGAEAFVFPSLYEGFGLAALEAMACGTPVIAADRTALPEVVGDGGLLLDPDDEEAWARAFGSLARDGALWEQRRRRALGRAERFCWTTASDEMLAVAREVAAERGPRG